MFDETDGIRKVNFIIKIVYILFFLLLQPTDFRNYEIPK